ncbi:hypothetical protein BX616_002906 [Lobosporangium transversale]|uniref:Sodium/hydrogen exchanger family-domain-containing protein n=1 Tax=Lobosporangium transversale TaxID=64571 RepID=A0A1Y2GQY3_9FUNG|nr:Sodium/hydrogen exchanger family-domain-containing protein [Lobosporangium transversale]KAF9899657.1 hypothetical protein BX616_002906 [Lobosporangium transversale]ORZ17552.1 Sodium/hydrogen exchanger family-domain-containing protein [Lobosporangium transversale]|eukprot:XP_021881939.1 Sodium/hydrogen exchanger family-domain-containing protein [Lobosporangium transversale]
MFSLSLLYFGLFVLALCFTGSVFEDLFHCRLLGELLIGLLFGNLGQLLPVDKTVLYLAGELGVLALIFEAGICTQLHKVARVGLRAALIGLIGTIIPLLTGFGFIYLTHHQYSHQLPDESNNSSGSPPAAAGVDLVIEALASGAALASTSIAIAVTMMKQRDILDTFVGTLITTAAMLDDVISLILLGIISALGGGSGESGSRGKIRPMTILQPVLASLGIVIVALIACFAVWKLQGQKRPTSSIEAENPTGTEMQHVTPSHTLGQTVNTPECSRRNSARKDDVGQEGQEVSSQSTTSQHTSPQPNSLISLYYRRFSPIIFFSAMILIGLGYSILAEYIGSSKFLGAFMAGVFCSTFPILRQLHHERVANTVQPALNAIFFATIGFSIPLEKILEPTLFGWGVLYAIIASLSKLATAVAVPSNLADVAQQESDGTQEEEQQREEQLDAQDHHRHHQRKSNSIHDRWMVGTAMIARGELGLLIAQQAMQQGVMGQAVMVISTWSIVLCTLVGIAALGFIMNKV